jgi:hypothetical protein
VLTAVDVPGRKYYGIDKRDRRCSPSTTCAIKASPVALVAADHQNPAH